jgi:biopolymer transport protein ExbB
MNQTDATIVSVLLKMGLTGQIIILLIFVLSMISLFIFVERMITLKRSTVPSQEFIQKIKEAIYSNNPSAAKDYCIRTNSPLSRVILKGIQRLGMPMRDIELAMENQINLEIYQFELGENVLSLVSKLAPMLGFIGTIAGVIQIFYDINATGEYNIETISGGLYIKMITSALGLGLGILAYFFYFVVSNKVKKSIYHLDSGASEFIDIISQPIK